MKLPFFNEHDAVLSGFRTISLYPLRGRMGSNIRNCYKQIGDDLENLPKLPRYVSGNIDLMIGIKYLSYHLEKIFQLNQVILSTKIK